MGTKTPAINRKAGLADALFSPVQQRVLGLLFGQPSRRFQSAEIIRMAASGTGAVHRQLARLAEAGWVTVDRAGNHKYYQANRASPAFEELHGLIVKTVGVVDPIRQAIAPFGSRIRAAFVYGSVARGDDRARSDIDLMVISDGVRYPDLHDALHLAERRLGRTINPNVMTAPEWRKKGQIADSFASRIATQPKLFIIGSDGDLA